MSALNYTEEIFNILSRGGFISNNSISPKIRRIYDAIEDHQADYDEYFSGIGFHLEAGDGYFFFTRKEQKVDLQRKLEAVGKWIDYLTFLKTYNSTFGPGLVFSAADIVVRINCDMELKELAGKLFTEKKSYDEIVDKLIAEMERMGFIEQQNELEKTWKVLSSFHYIEELIDCISITDDTEYEDADKAMADKVISDKSDKEEKEAQA